MSIQVPRRGDIVWLRFNPQAGHEQAGTRPALVLSPESYNRKTSLCIVCPITNQSKGYPFEVTLPPECPVTGVVLADQLKSLDWRARKAAFSCRAPNEVVMKTLTKASLLLK